MVNTNLKIINEFKIFLDDVSKDESLRRLVSYSKPDFSRNRKLPIERLAGLKYLYDLRFGIETSYGKQKNYNKWNSSKSTA